MDLVRVISLFFLCTIKKEVQVTPELANEVFQKYWNFHVNLNVTKTIFDNARTYRIQRLVKKVVHREQRKFTNEEERRIEALLLSNTYFTQLLLSLHFPFFKKDIEQYGHRLLFGSDYHSFAQFDEWEKEGFDFAEFGLSFNENTLLFQFQPREYWINELRFKTYTGDASELLPFATEKFPLNLTHELTFRRMFKDEILGRDRREEERIAMINFYNEIDRIHLFKKMEWTVDEIESYHSTYGFYFALCTYAWEYFFEEYFTEDRFHKIMQQLDSVLK